MSNPPGFFSFSNLARNVSAYLLFIFDNPICVTLFCMGAVYEIRQNIRNAGFLLFMFAETFGFWLMSGTVSVSREYLYIHIPLCLMAARALPTIFSIAREMGGRPFKAAVAGAGMLFAGIMFLHPPPILKMFKAHQGMDREIRTYLKGMPRNYDIVIRPEYSAVVSPERNNLLPSMEEISVERLGDNIMAAKSAGIERIVCFAPAGTKYDCGFLEIWLKQKNAGDKVDYSKDVVHSFNFDTFYSSRAGEMRIDKPFVHITELIL
jgi:hypothetical protein